MRTVEVPDGLAVMAAGPELGAALDDVPLSAVPNDRMLDVLAAQYRQLCHEQARMAAVLAELARCECIPAPGAVTRADAPHRYAPDETRAALRWTRHAADVEHGLAESVVHGMPELFAAWLAGAVDRPRVRVFDQYLTGLPAEQVEQICRVAVPRAPELTTGRLAHLLRRMVIAVDPDAAARWYRKGVRERNVTAYPAPDGTITMSANGLPADEAEAACERIGQLASAAKRAGHPGLIGQIRCDLFLGLLDGRFHGLTTAQVVAALVADARIDGVPGSAVHRSRARRDPDPRSTPAAAEGDQRVGIEIRVGLATLLGRDEHPAEIPGLGLLPAPDARLRVQLQGRAEWRFAVTDAAGALLSEGRTGRRPDGVRRDGPRGGIVELHMPEALLHALAADPGSGWARVVADIAAQHADRERHLADLDARPGARLPGAALRRHTEIRDRTCTFSGVCRHPARSADMDHAQDHARGGPTERLNIGPLCDHDHYVKHRAGWTVGQPQPGTFVWRSPLGGEYVSRGEFLLPDLPEPAPIPPRPTSDLRAAPSRGRSCDARPRRHPPHDRPRVGGTRTSRRSEPRGPGGGSPDLLRCRS